MTQEESLVSDEVFSASPRETERKVDHVHNSTPKLILARWHQLIDGLEYSPDEFYSSLEKELRKRNIPRLKFARVSFQEKGSFSGDRVYLRLLRDELIFDICASPIGKGAFFVSYWHGFRRFHGIEGIVMRIGLIIPLLGSYLEKNFIPNTYYHADSTEMFQQLVHEVLMNEINSIIEEASLPALTEEDKKPEQKKLLNV